MSSTRKVITTFLETPVRGPGGHWSHYRAMFEDDQDGNVGYGDTALEAEKTLRAQAK